LTLIVVLTTLSHYRASVWYRPTSLWFLAQDSILERYMLWPWGCVTMSVHLSATSQYGMKTAEHRIFTQTTPHNTPRPLAFCWQRFWWNLTGLLQKGAKHRRNKVKIAVLLFIVDHALLASNLPCRCDLRRQ